MKRFSELILIYPSKGVILCSNRGYVHQDGTVSIGGVINSTVLSTRSLIIHNEDHVRITGLVIQGPDPAVHESHHTRSFTLYKDPLAHTFYYNLQTTDGIVVYADNTEIAGEYCYI
ncbi:MAG TPA: hypothetical protein DCY74_05785 [Clostridiales bacterium]|nr:hypothetical protein [Clostridiales bacterium]HCG35007.1 hypothetical protein [Clostridiales bacterium]